MAPYELVERLAVYPHRLAHAQAWILVAAPFAVVRGRTADKPSGVGLANLLRALQDAVHRPHCPVLAKVLPSVSHRWHPDYLAPTEFSAARFM
jgi:hypothetical protein